ncbi:MULTISPECIES: protein-glutamate O-methyltransferase CheR [unclassified Pseudomonas]|uniref:CheR family methyltransferase n=1 Tax=unclassified Pseudomonas TaxID=196821 RepID=UPI002AC8D2C7|nr:MULTISPECIES: protein-glutamate O-methyltransferase CheR [unclassified Pseudomonas]MEB0040802.1 protein-glutamate O-methyltransferase CheR [Pseudomonas sp. MH10]MEB0076315.1 protein-glutamate O-methyltransferase CheR [Pseudomonas sp. MH10out]MEB0093715.1 protein-glutamate O-methyltransferase CheR [Pseudomonas sp. CCI4.2]MEB0101046.1 protein-glutamate O-methyltransferase CheR [Pseudomonas sp. CCI3.2]MEB0122971.1 protein-glutamate O-methyltransferase CheR [Pseudomonas sp. CCI1.2]
MLTTASLNDREFDQFQTWLYRTSGINLSPAKKALVAGRLFKRLKHYQLDSYGDYFTLIMGNQNTPELQIALDLLTTNETYFFREPKHFDFLRQEVLTKARPGQLFRVWSAASSSGEEPYSLAMTLAEGLGTTPWEVVGSDISTQVLLTARNGHYPMERARTLPQPLLVKYCLKGTGSQDGTFLIGKALRNRVNFIQVNLNEALPNLGEFDVIFLRNVMIYFDQDTKRKVVARIFPLLKPGGHLIISHSESLNGVSDALKMVTPSIYRKP